MTKRNLLKLELLKLLEIKLINNGYKLNKSKCEFTKINSLGWFKYQLIFLLTDFGWMIKPCLLIRFNIVEDIFHQISGFEKKFHKGTPTIGTSIEDYEKRSLSYRFELNEESQINEVVEKLYKLFLEKALPFFERYKSIESIERVLNLNPNDISLTGGIFKGTKSLIVAKLFNNTEYDKLKNIYFDYYKNNFDGFYLPEYVKLVNLLSKENVNRNVQL